MCGVFFVWRDPTSFWHIMDNCVSHWTDTTTLARGKDTTVKLLKETWFIYNHRSCISYACFLTVPSNFDFFLFFFCHVCSFLNLFFCPRINVSCIWNFLVLCSLLHSPRSFHDDQYSAADLRPLHIYFIYCPTQYFWRFYHSGNEKFLISCIRLQHSSLRYDETLCSVGYLFSFMHSLQTLKLKFFRLRSKNQIEQTRPHQIWSRVLSIHTCQWTTLHGIITA